MTLTPSEHRNPQDRLSFTRREGIALSLCALLGAALRLYRLDAQSVWYDEAFTVAHSLKPLPDLVDVLLRDAVHPPLHYLIVHGWLGMSGGGAWEARLVSALAGTLSIPVLYLLARRFTDAATSACAALLLAVSQIAIYFSQEARPYMVAQFLSLLAAGSFLWLLRRPSFGRTAAFAAASLALMATHYYGIATLAALGLYWLMFRREHSPLVFRSILVAATLVVAAYLPWLLGLGSGRVPRQDVFRAAWDTTQRPGLLAPMMALNRFNNGKLDSIEGESPAATVVLGLGIFTLPIVAAFWLRGGRARDAATSRRRVQGAVLGCLLAGMPVAFAILLGASGAIFNYRHFSFAVPGYYLAVAIGWRVCFRHPVARGVWMVAAFAWSAWALRANYFAPTKPDYRTALAPLAAAYRSGDCAVIRPGIYQDAMHLAWDVYYRDRGSPRVIPFDSIRSGLADCDRIWFIWDKTWWMNRSERQRTRTLEAIAALRQNFDQVEHDAHRDLELRLMRKRTR